MAVNTLISVVDAIELDDVLFVDCRFNLADPAAGEHAFQEGHISGAQFLDLEKDLSGDITPGETGRHPLPNKTNLVDTMHRIGVRNGQPVVAYDQANGAFAARLWWLLRDLGHASVWVLDGGLAAWQAAGQPTDSEISTPAHSEFSPSDSLCLTIEADSLATTSMPLFDARDEVRYRGEQEPIDPVAGHIPGALCLPFSANLTDAGQFKSPEQLKRHFLETGVPETEPAVCYCGSGVTACHNVLALRHAGFPEPYLYGGSWSEWITDPTRPVATGND